MDETLTECLHCHKLLPPDCYWKGRKTCIECAQELWYSPHTEVDPTSSPNWSMVENLVRQGLVSFSNNTDIIGGPARALSLKMAKLGLVKFPAFTTATDEPTPKVNRNRSRKIRRNRVDRPDHKRGDGDLDAAEPG